MRRLLPFLAVLLFLSSAEAADNIALIGTRRPSLSPDGRQLAFSYLGDIWIASTEGGLARRLTDHEAYDHAPVWSPDGRFIAFSSPREGHDDVFLIPSEGGELRRLTWHSGNDRVTDFSPDGQNLVFTSNRKSWSGLYEVSLEGGLPRPLQTDYWSTCASARYHPSGKQLVFSEGYENNYWWRRGYRGSNSTTLWLMDRSSKALTRLYQHPSNSFWPSFGPSGERVYFVSDRSGVKNIWAIPRTGGKARAITQFKRWGISGLSIARKAPKAIYEHRFGLWITDLESGQSKPIIVRAPSETKRSRQRIFKKSRVSEYHLSQDGRKMAAIVRGDVFVSSISGGYARNLTSSLWRERSVLWLGDNKSLIFISDKDADLELYRASALGDEPIKQLTKGEGDLRYPRLSPNGRLISYLRGKRELRLVTPDGKKDRLLTRGEFGGRFGDPATWSPDSEYLATSIYKEGQSDVVIIDVKKGTIIPAANTGYSEDAPFWSDDGRSLFFRANRFGHSFPEFTGKRDFYRLRLQPKATKFEEDDYEQLFKGYRSRDDWGKVELKLKDLNAQTEAVTNTLGNDWNLVASKRGGKLYFVSNVDGKAHLWSTSLPRGKPSRIKAFATQVSNPGQLQFDRRGRYLYYLSGGKVGRIDLNSERSYGVTLDTEVRVKAEDDYQQMLTEIYLTLKQDFYDEKLHDVDWDSAYKAYSKVLSQVREDRDFYDYANQMIGLLNSSHTGVRAPRGASITDRSAHLGADFKTVKEGLQLTRLLPGGPLSDLEDPLKEGDILTEINGQSIAPNPWTQLNGQLGKRLILTFKGKKPRKVTIKAISDYSERVLRRKAWVASRKALVKKASGGQLAYIHMKAMGKSDLNKFLLELEGDAVRRKGLILDLRFNMGGNVHDRVIQALTKPVYAKWRIRGIGSSRQSTFGFADKPVIVLINEVTLSDGEMLSNGLKQLERARLLGRTTYGWLIFTRSVGLMNGASFRLPFWGCYTLDGKNLERSGGVTPHQDIPMDLRHRLKGQDPQLEAAIQALKKGLRKLY